MELADVPRVTGLQLLDGGGRRGSVKECRDGEKGGGEGRR